MRKLLGLGAMVLGVVGVLLCAAAIGLGWRVAFKTVERIDRVAARLDHGLSEGDERIARAEARMNAVRSEIEGVRGAVETLAAENPDLPRVRVEIERLLDRLIPALDRAEAMAESLQTLATSLRTMVDIVSQFEDESEMGVRLKNAADTIDHAAEELRTPQARIQALKSSKAAQWTHDLATLIREAIASSERLAAALATTRREITACRERVVNYRDWAVIRVNASAVAHTLLWLWLGLGQLCLIGWGRRRLLRRGTDSSPTPPNREPPKSDGTASPV